MSQSLHTTSTDPKIWGPVLWKFLHIMAHNYPENPNPQTKASSRQFFYSLRHLLPCETCRTHYSEFLSKRQPETDSPEALQEWLLWLHNEVTARTNPDAKPWTMLQLNEWLKSNVNSQPKLEQKNKQEVKDQTSTSFVNVQTSQHEMQFSPRSTDKNNSLLIAQQMHKRLSVSRQMSVAHAVLGPDQRLQQSNQPVPQPISPNPPLPHLIRQVPELSRHYHSHSAVKSEKKSDRIPLKSEIVPVQQNTRRTHNSYNSYNRKSLLPRNGRNLLTTFRSKYSSTQRGRSIQLSAANAAQVKYFKNQQNQTSSVTHQQQHTSTESSGTKKTCGCKNKK